jgi:hypothetical protein
MRLAIKHLVAALHGQVRERLGNMTLAKTRRTGDILPIPTNSTSRFTIAFIRVTGSAWVSFEHTAFAANAPT